MDEIGRIVDKLDVIAGDITEMKVVLAKHSLIHEQNSEQLKEHIRRTALAERRIEHIERHVQKVQGIFWFVGVVCAGIGVLVTMKGLWK